MERKYFELSKVRMIDDPDSFGKAIQGCWGDRFINIVITEEEYNKLLEDYLYEKMWGKGYEF